MSRIIACTILVAFSCASQAATITYGDFSDASALTLNGAAGQALNGGQYALRLTGTGGPIAGSAYLTNLFSLGTGGSFSTVFQFRMSNVNASDDPDGPGADGLAFVVQSTSSSALGTGGGYFGYGSESGNVLPNSLAVEFDTYRNTGWATDIDGNHVAIDLNGDVTNSVAIQSVSPRMNDGTVWTAWIDYNGAIGQLEVRLSDAGARPMDALLLYPIDLLSTTGTGNVFLGFSAGIAGGQQNHDILNWALTDSYSPFGATVPEPGTLGLMGLGLSALILFRRSWAK